MSPGQRESERLRQLRASRRETDDQFPVDDQASHTSGYSADKSRMFYWLLGVVITLGALLAGWMMNKVLEHGDRLTRIEVLLEHIGNAVGARP